MTDLLRHWYDFAPAVLVLVGYIAGGVLITLDLNAEDRQK